jgi:ABC-type lipoprotein release transport system permease subunit
MIGMSPYDAPTFTAVALLILAVAAVATSVPARRATRADPLEALKAD